MLAATGLSLPGFSWVVFGSLLAIFLSSAAVFFALVHRLTRGRARVELVEWAREHRASLRPLHLRELPPPLAGQLPEIRMSVRAPRAQLARLAIGEKRWNVLVRKTGHEWIPSGLRPATHELSVFDALQLPVYPAYSTAERFHLMSADNSAARKLSKSSTRALVPADVGLLLWGEWLVLDFTHRPFDPIEFGRMLALAEQIVHSLP
ncbi:MAG: hypothetical protein JO353_11185 [Phycisphaerae bacterium]|nr:hypothetical protein [Phycisphaerae bacterium]